MKFKYYLRGLSIGILVTVIILAISSAFHKNEISDDEVIARAKKLGMVMAEQEEDKIPEGEESDGQNDVPSTEEGSKDTPGDSTQDESSDNTQVTQTEFTVEVGESSNQVAQKLADLRLVDDAAAFNQYMVDNGYDERVRAGTIVIPQGADYEMLVQLLTGEAAE